MIQVVGTLAIVGPLNVALMNDPSILIFKTVLDFTSTLIYGAKYGLSVMLSGPLVLVYQAAIYLLAGVVSPFLTTDPIHEMSAIGSALIFALSLDLLGIIRVKTTNYLPAILGPVIYYGILNWL